MKPMKPEEATKLKLEEGWKCTSSSKDFVIFTLMD